LPIVFFSEKGHYRAGECQFDVMFGKGVNVMNKKSANRQRHNQSQHRLKPVYAAVLLAFSVQSAQANPTGGSVVNGSASFATSGNTLTVTNTPGTIINWQGFSINSNEITKFAQQSASSTVLNRVVGSNPSNLLGTLQSNGRVFLVNPNGILFGTGAVVDVAGLVASTLNLSDADFLAGNNHFTEVPGAASISNDGNISAQQGGQIFMIAPNVENTGVITAPNGEIFLAAGHSVDLVSTDNPNLRVNITAPAGEATNVGQLIASSGSLGLFGAVVRNSGVVSADSATMQGGKIVFKASQLAEVGGTVSAIGKTGGDIQVLGDQVAVLGNMDASGNNGGGTVLVGGDAHGANPDVPNAQYTYVDGNSTIKADATGNGNGGKVVVWADNATQFSGNISARGGAQSGDGGWVETSGKQSLGFAGLVDTTAAHGLTGSLLLDPTDITISTATNTPTMLWTVSTVSYFNDLTNTPSNLNIGVLQTQLGLTNVTVDSTTSTLPGAGNITVQDSIAWNNANSLTLNAAGVITVNALTSTSTPLTITNTSTASTGGLSMTATGPITIGGAITLAGGTFDVNANGATISMTGALNAGAFKLSSGTWKQVSATLPGFTANNGFNVTGGTFIRALGGDGSTANPYQMSDIYGVQGIGSVGMLGNAYVLAKNIDATVTKNWFDVNGLPVGFAPIGTVYPNDFTGQFDGQNHTISNLTINLAGISDVGLFGVATNGSISNVGLVNASVSGASNVGGLVGSNYYGSISNSYVSGGTISATGNNVGGLVGYYSNSSGGTISASYVNGGSVTGASNVGGLVGFSQYGSISGSHVDTVTVTGTGSAIGGMVGNNNNSSDGGPDISITNSYVNNGTVSGSSEVGGLVGYNDGGAISNSYVSGGTVSATGNYAGGLVGYNTGNSGSSGSGMNWTGSLNNSYVSNGTVVSGFSDVGGLVGYVGFISSSISNSHVSGAVKVISGATDSSANAGGLVGYNTGTISNSYASNGSVSSSAGTTSNFAFNFGGLVGYNTGNIDTSFVSGGSVMSAGTGAYNLGGLVGDNSSGGTISNTFASGGTVSGYSSVGGLAGNNTGKISNSYANNGVVGSNSVGGLVGDNGGTVTASFWNTTVAGPGGIGTGSITGAAGLTSTGMMTMSNFTNAGWDISNTLQTTWVIVDGVTMPLLSIFVTQIAAAPTVIDQIIYLIDQQEKPKPGDLLAAAKDILTGEDGNPLPMCN
jgi:filamentous hemagglutinin family protein